jgi:hypothetical protein
VKLIEEELTTGRQFGCSEAAVRAAFGGYPAWEMALTTAVWAEYLPLGVESTQGASTRWIDGSGSVRAKSARGRSYL